MARSNPRRAPPHPTLSPGGGEGARLKQRASDTLAPPLRDAACGGSSGQGGERIGARGLSADALLARVLYRDGLMLVIDKPAGLAVHAGPSGGPNLEQGFGALRFGLPRPPGLAHRLDRDTSGCLVLGRHPKALRKLGRLFAEGRVEKVYWALVAGAPQQDEGRIELALKKLTRKDGWRMVVDPDGQRAVTDYRVLAKDDRVAWLELRPRTGRTHQIRVHCAALGCPVLGDPVYGAGEGPLQLHSRAIVLPLYPAKPPIAVEAPPPPHMASALAAHGWQFRKTDQAASG